MSIASSDGHVKIEEVLLGACAFIEATKGNQSTPLHLNSRCIGAEVRSSGHPRGHQGHRQISADPSHLGSSECLKYGVEVPFGARATIGTPFGKLCRELN